MRLVRLLALLSVVLGWTAADAEVRTGRDGRQYYVPEMPKDLDQVDVYLLTAGLGPELYARFGHTGIRVKDRAAGTDLVFNWGQFSFDEPGFAWKFFRGSLTYRMGVRAFPAEVEHFLDNERRLVQETLNLSQEQKRVLLEKIRWNADPENRRFPYQYWFQNCATIPRDYLDLALDGQLKARLATAPADAVFRDYVRGNLAASPFVAPSLDVLMNGNIDRPISKWEEMFLPAKLRETLLTMPALDDEGRPIEGRMLLSDPVVLVGEPEDYATRLPDYEILLAIAWLPLVLGVGLVAASGKKPALRAPGYRALGLAGILWGTVAAVLGTTLLLNWLVSGHPDAWHNANLLVFFPLDWLFVALGVRIFRQGGRVKDRIGFVGAGRALCALHAVGLVLLVALAATGVIAQDVWRVVVAFGLPTVALAASYATLAFGEPAPARQLAEDASPFAAVPRRRQSRRV